MCTNAELCIENNGNEKSIKCNKGYYLPSKQYICEEINEINGCSEENEGYCTKCISKRYLKNGECIDNSKNCLVEIDGRCLQCDDEYLLVFGKCLSQEEIHCNTEIIDGYCSSCDINEYKDKTGCYLLNQSNYEYCKSINYEKNGCNECYDGYYLDSKFQCIKINSKSEMKGNDIDRCAEPTTKGCMRCKDGYYMVGRECKACDFRCSKCLDEFICNACGDQMFLDNGNCIEINQAFEGCQTMIPSNKGCLLCGDGYFKKDEERECHKCDESCATCRQTSTCSNCKEGYWKKPETTGLCYSYDELTHCITKTKTGCTECEAGYYLNNYQCHQCRENCSSCYRYNECYSCQDEYVLKDISCIHYKQIEHCLQASNSVCTLCEENYSLSENNQSCELDKKVSLVIILVIITIIISIIIIITIVPLSIAYCVFKTEDNMELKGLLETETFTMKNSNIIFNDLGNNLVSDKKMIFFREDEGTIPVLKESKQTVCIGNKGRHRLKIQLTTKENSYKYVLITNPQAVTLKPGEACEFEIFLKPLCTITLDENIIILSINIKKGIQHQTPLAFFANTEVTTKLDPDDLFEEKKLGEGSFGIVYLGKFRGNKVAIKKMKKSIDEHDTFEEFEKEVAMLDKFRCEYLITFHGAVVIPGKVCMVTEYAPFGSIQDLMKNRPNCEGIDNLLRVKFILDCAKGIKYLHNNGILHRDIKPDNFLVISIDANSKVNCKLTDFGSSRNVNILISNITFTKGVGSPKYMSPELLERKKYKKPSDIYSFAITILEIMIWKNAFPKNDFKFAWDIAESVIEKKRPDSINEVTNSVIREIIEKSWCHNPKERLTIDQIVMMIENELTYLNRWY